MGIITKLRRYQLEGISGCYLDAMIMIMMVMIRLEVSMHIRRVLYCLHENTFVVVYSLLSVFAVSRFLTVF